MNAIGDFFKNRLNFDCEDIIHHNLGNLDFADKSFYKYESKYFNLLDFKIKNSYDLLERILPNLYFVASTLKNI